MALIAYIFREKKEKTTSLQGGFNCMFYQIRTDI